MIENDFTKHNTLTNNRCALCFVKLFSLIEKLTLL